MVWTDGEMVRGDITWMVVLDGGSRVDHVAHTL